MTQTERQLPAEYVEKPSAYLAERLAKVAILNPLQKQYLQAVLAGLRVTETPFECDQLERLLNAIPVSHNN